MKIHVNYDLMEKIVETEKGITLNKTIKDELSIWLSFFCFASVVDITLTHGKLLTYNIIRCASWFIICTVLERVLFNVSKELMKKNATTTLTKLTRQLSNLDIRTNVELLKEAELVHSNYKLKLSDNKLPVLKQDKYIKIPIVNGMGERFEETLYQEHIVGTKSYDLSVKEPDKKVQVKRKLAMQM